MKRTLKPTGSRYGNFPKRQAVAQVQTQSRSKFYDKRRGNFYSAFQKSSGIEKKNIDDTSPKISTGVATWTITCLNDVVQGTTAITRIGRKILMKSLLVQGSASVATGQLRIVIVYDRQPNGVIANATDIFTSNTLMAAQNLDNRDRFITLADIFPFDQSENIMNPSNNNDSIVGWKRFIKMNLETIYSGNAGTIGDITTGALLICTSTNGGAVIGETGLQRVRFIDE